jgi:hypothetical protein
MKSFINNKNVNITTTGGQNFMAKWKLFNKTKNKEEETPESKEETEEIEEEKIEENEETTPTENEDEPLDEYHETLHTGTTKKQTTQTHKTPSNQRLWRDVDAIEENVDNIHMRKANKPVTNLDKTVDKLIEKRKKK